MFVRMVGCSGDDDQWRRAGWARGDDEGLFVLARMVIREFGRERTNGLSNKKSIREPSEYRTTRTSAICSIEHRSTHVGLG